MTEEEPDSVGAGTVSIDCAATAHVVSTKSSLENDVDNRIGCRARKDGLCGISLAEPKVALTFRLLSEEN